MNTVSTRCFSKSQNNTWIASDASIMGWPALHAPETFTLTSEWTGRSIAMEKVHTETDDEGDIILWMYKPANRNAGINLTAEIFND